MKIKEGAAMLLFFWRIAEEMHSKKQAGLLIINQLTRRIRVLKVER